MLSKILSSQLNVVDSVTHTSEISRKLIKNASKTTSESLINEVKKAQESVGENTIVALCFAVFPFEVFGENDNGDSVFEKEFKPFVSGLQTLPAATPTYMEKGSVYMFHKSDDPSKSIGDIHYANYNEEQHRVELVISVKKKKAPEIYRKLKRKKPILVSMGCGVEYDVCSICGNRASTADQHCDHVKYHLLDFVDGIPVHMINAGMVYFDISYVVVNGDINARVTYVAD